MATTIIDFSPQALEVDEIAQAAKHIEPNIPAPLSPTLSTEVNVNVNREYGNQFLDNAPDILFVAEYAAQGQEAVGALIVWENYYNASHYEVWKRVYTSQDQKWQRILIVDSTRLKIETDQYRSYIADRLKLQIKTDYYAILDTDVTKDQIVQYKITAGKYPASAAFDYQLALKSQNQLNSVSVNGTDTIFDFSNRVLKSSDYAWIVSLVNPKAEFFGRDPATKTLASFAGNTVDVPKDLSVIPKMVQESIYFFGLLPTLANMFSYTRDSTDIAGKTNFFQLVLESVNSTGNYLSYNSLQTKLKAAYPKYADYISRLGTGQLKQQPIAIPNYSDATAFNSLTDLTYMFLRLNTILVGVIYSLDYIQLAHGPVVTNSTSPSPFNPTATSPFAGTPTSHPSPFVSTSSPFAPNKPSPFNTTKTSPFVKK